MSCQATLEYIHELLKKLIATKKPAEKESLKQEIFTAAFPLLQRWTDDTPVTKEGLIKEGWIARDSYLLFLDTRHNTYKISLYYNAANLTSKNTLDKVILNATIPGAGSLVIPVRTFGQLRGSIDLLDSDYEQRLTLS